MSGEGWLMIRARLRRDAAVRAIAPLLLPEGDAPRSLAAHRLVWALLADGPDRRRDFLWREEAPGNFLILSRHEPAGLVALFDIEVKSFAPALSKEDRLGFLLRANATVARSPRLDGRRRGKRHDVVMDAIYQVPQPERAMARRQAIVEQGGAWLAAQGARHGFTIDIDQLRIDGYRSLSVPRTAGEPAEIGVLDFEGILTVDDPERFGPALTCGLGRARSFGCGLMLIRRV